MGHSHKNNFIPKEYTTPYLFPIFKEENLHSLQNLHENKLRVTPKTVWQTGQQTAAPGRKETDTFVNKMLNVSLDLPTQ